jgi:hypothetical protein
MDQKTFEFMKKVYEAAENIKWGESSAIDCPNCKGILHVGRSEINGHIWAKCEKCNYFLMQ